MAKGAPAELRKGPRGGGRDRDKMVAHVVEALRSARRPQPQLATKIWPWRYTARRVAWHALDHAWEMQDRSE